MSTNQLLIASLSLNEAITQCVLENRRSFPMNIDCVELNDILNNYDIHDELSDECSIIRWIKNDKVVISNQTHFLLNRIVFMPDVLFNDFIIDDREYAKREFEAYLGYALNSFKSFSGTAFNGLCEHVYSLPQQWDMVSRLIHIRVPKYFWGPSSMINLGNHIYKQLVYSDIYNVMNWSLSNNSCGNQHTFCFEKPGGDPVFLLIVGREMLITYDNQLSNHQRNKLLDLAEKIRKSFNYFIFEILFFVTKKDIVFGCVNIEPVRSKHNKNFSNFVCRNLINEFRQ